MITLISHLAFVLTATVLHQEILRIRHFCISITWNINKTRCSRSLSDEQSALQFFVCIILDVPCREFLMSHFVQKVVLSAWPWRIYPFAPCSFFLHSLLMTNVKRISSLHESSHSTRTKRVSRMAVIQSVSKLSDTHLHKESMYITCRAEGWVRLSRWHFLLSLMITSCCLRSFSFRGIAVFVTAMPIGWKERHFCSLSCLFICPWWFCTTQFFPCRERVGAISAALRFILLFVSPCWLFCVCTETDLRPTALPRMFCLCSGCLPSSLSLFWCSLDGH